MVGASPARWLTVAFAIAAIAVAVVLGTQLRLKDPLSTSVLPAEDTFTHMGLVQAHLSDGDMDAYNPNGRLYPPGMHTVLAAFWVYTGLDLYDIMRFAPVLFGILGIVGAAAVVWAYEGPVGGVIAAFTTAASQEMIRRTTMMAPTAVDVALLPFAFLAIIETMRGRHAFASPAAALVLFFVFAHPWVVTIIGLATAVFGVISLAAPWVRRRSTPLQATGVAIAMAIVGVGWSLSLSGCGGWCGPGFAEVIPNGERLNALAPLIAAAALTVATITYLARKKLDDVFQPVLGEPSLAGRILAAAAIAGVLAVITVPAATNGFPRFVDPPLMFGWPTLALAAMGLILIPFMRGPAAYLGASIVLVTWPFVIYDPFNSPFWSHRTAIYFGLGAVLLAGVAAAALGRFVAHTVELHLTASPRYRHSGARPVYAVLAMLVVAGTLSGAVAASAPSPDNTAWYRLYGECELAAFQTVAHAVDGKPEDVIIMGDWQAKLVVTAFAELGGRIWLKSSVYNDQYQRDDTVKMAREGHRPVLVLVDRHTKTQTPDANLDAFKSDPWEVYGTWCSEEPGHTLIAYNVRGVKP
jgi:hypothetical protein